MRRRYPAKKLFGDSCFLCPARNGKYGQRTDHYPLQGGECRLHDEIVRDRCHYVLSCDRKRCKTPRKYATECCVPESTRKQATIALREGVLVDPRKEECL